MRHEPLLCSMTWFIYRVVARYRSLLFSANINGSSLGWLENTKKSTQPTVWTVNDVLS